MANAYVAYGRFSAPHAGHVKVIRQAYERAKQDNVPFYLYVSKKHGGAKNPVSYEKRLNMLDMLLGEEIGNRIVLDKSVRSPEDAYRHLRRHGYKKATIFTGDDNEGFYGDIFDSVESVNRDDLPISSTLVREAVEYDDAEAFEMYYYDSEPETIERMWREVKQAQFNESIIDN